MTAPTESRAVMIAPSPRGQAALAAVQVAPASMDAFRLAAIFYKSGLFKDVKDEAQAAIKILYGAEIGITPMQSMLGIFVIDGKPSLGAGLIANLIKRSGRYTFRTTRHDAQGCTLAFFEREGGRWNPLGESTFTLADAQLADLAGKGTWKKYPQAMLFARALSQGARWYAADVFGGSVYTPEELGAEVDEEGAVTGAPVLRTARAETVASPGADQDEVPPRADAELCRYRADGKPIWTVDGTECLVHANGRGLTSIEPCPIHGSPFGLGLDLTDTDWRHGKGETVCRLHDVLDAITRGDAVLGDEDAES